jgi:uncharacterized membrane protein YfcA
MSAVAGSTTALGGSRTAPATALVPVALMTGVALVLYLFLQPAIAAPGFRVPHFFGLAGILFAAGFMSGLAGFAFSAVGSLSLLLLPPILGVPLLQGLSAVNQLLSLRHLRDQMPRTAGEWWPAGPGPCILGGLVSVPLGVWVLNNLPAVKLMLLFGVMLTLYSLYSLVKPAHLRIERFDGAVSGVVVGAIGGTIGGFTAFPGMAVVVWTGLRDLSKAATRAIVQPFILTLQIVSLGTNIALHPHNFGVRFWALFLATIPVVLPGTIAGVTLYHRISETNFKRSCFVLLLIAGAGLILKAL